MLLSMIVVMICFEPGEESDYDYDNVDEREVGDESER